MPADSRDLAFGHLCAAIHIAISVLRLPIKTLAARFAKLFPDQVVVCP